MRQSPEYLERQTIALRAIVKERDAQDKKWGEQNHDPLVWMSILMEEVGEMAEAVLAYRFDGPSGSRKGAIMDEATQVAAVALAILECADRNGWREIGGP